MTNLVESDFIDFVTSLFPSISPYSKQQVKLSLAQFYENGKTFECFNDSNIEGLCQGDILSAVPFFKILPNGEIATYFGEGIILSNSCDIENDDYILMAPFYPIDDIDFDASRKKDLMSNRLYGFLYFPDCSEENVFADLSKIVSLPKKIVIKSINDNVIVKKHSLSLVAYYLLICKLTVHFLRPEDEGLQAERKHIDFKFEYNLKKEIPSL